MRIDEDVFNEQMRGLMVARGNYLSAKDKDEKKRYWYLEFRDCDEQAFIRTMGKLKFGEGSFPSYAEFQGQYNIVMPPGERLAGREYCGLCVGGAVFYRDLNINGEVHDMSAGCSRCSPKRESQVNPHKLHKDKVGVLRTFEALKVDRIPQEIKWPPFLKEKFLKFNKKIEPQYFLGLLPEDDPDVKMEFVKAAPELVKVPY